ncbi:hypothetical protein O181_004027 [Austropuccinia psidii MF-1]|uniref:Uncharacterized protein n=1 Tax=Austropuccinia psidii MF-1 TaxID=1389203 RepID=A0A9Q3BFZ2_9BASI|nr:hypothetical protein [Austropuccinia psidii MF-1]
MSAHLSTAQVLVTGESFDGTVEELIIDCGATHHIFNFGSLLSSFVKTPGVGVCTWNSTRSLSSKGWEHSHSIKTQSQFHESDFPFVQSSPYADAFEVTGNGEILDLGKLDEAFPLDPVEVVEKSHPTVLVEAEAVDEICSTIPDPVPEDN